MLKGISQAVIMLIASAGFVTAHATPFKYIVDHGTYTTDTFNKLDWLDMEPTVGKKYDYVSSQFGVGGEYEGWRYATGDELNGLFTQAKGSPVTGYKDVSHGVHTSPSFLDVLVAYMGATDNPSGHYFIEGLLADSGVEEKDAAFQWVAVMADLRFTDLPADIKNATNYVDYTQVRKGKQFLNATHNNDYGSFLVRKTSRSVSEPPMLSLLGLGLLGLVLSRKRSPKP